MRNNGVKNNSNEESKYTKLDKLGEGTYGIVYKAKNKINGEVIFIRLLQ